MQDKPSEKPVIGEQTKIQAVATFMGDFFGDFATAADKGNISTYRKMRKNPTIALARAVADIPIRMASWALQSTDEVPENITSFIQEQVNGLWPTLIEDMLRAKDYGFQAFEKVFALDSDGHYIYKKLKPLLAEKTRVIIDKDNGTFLGLRQPGISLLPAENCFWYTYDREPGNYYGRSIHENVRENAWHPWTEIAKQLLKYSSKVSAVIPIVRYPVGSSYDATGAEKANFDIAKEVLQSLGSGRGVAMPQEMFDWALDVVRQGGDPSQYLTWQISFLEIKGSHGTQYVKILQHFESLMMRGELVPERAAIEGMHGTKAEAGIHGDLAVSLADLVYQDIIRNINWYIINPLLVLNFGKQYENQVWVKRGGLDPTVTQLYRDIVKSVLTNPANVDLFQSWIDVNALIDSVGLPKSQEQIDSNQTLSKLPMSQQAFDIYDKLVRGTS